jgi:hypothetical protein
VNRRRQHFKGKKRPRFWHRGRAAGRLNDQRLREFEQAVAQAERRAA